MLLINFRRGALYTKVRAIDGNPFLIVPSARLKSAYDFLDGVSPDERAGGFKAYDSHAESIQDIIELLSDYYTNIDNKSFVGYDIWSIGKTYCEGDTWSNKVTQIIQEMKTN